MTNKVKNILFVVAGVIVGLLFATMFGGSNVGGVYSNVIKDFSDGISVDGTVVIDGSGNIDAPITSSTGTFSSTLSVSTTTPRDLLHVEGTTASSTALITSGGAGGGRIILEDSDGAGCSEIYILNGTIISATVTCPTGI